MHGVFNHDTVSIVYRCNKPLKAVHNSEFTMVKGDKPL